MNLPDYSFQAVAIVVGVLVTFILICVAVIASLAATTAVDRYLERRALIRTPTGPMRAAGPFAADTQPDIGAGLPRTDCPWCVLHPTVAMDPKSCTCPWPCGTSWCQRVFRGLRKTRRAAK